MGEVSLESTITGLWSIQKLFGQAEMLNALTGKLFFFISPIFAGKLTILFEVDSQFESVLGSQIERPLEKSWDLFLHSGFDATRIFKGKNTLFCSPKLRKKY